MFVHLEVIGQTEHLTSEHLGILAAVESGDSALAARLTREHLATSHDSILTYLLENQATAGGGNAPLTALHARRHPNTGSTAVILLRAAEQCGCEKLHRLVTADADADRFARIDAFRADEVDMNLFDRVLVQNLEPVAPVASRRSFARPITWDGRRAKSPPI